MLPGVNVADVIDCCRCQDGVWFVPALLDFEDGERWSRVDFFDQGVLEDSRFREVEQNYFTDIEPMPCWPLWLRSRIIAEFRIQPLIAGDTSRTSILDIGFVAAIFGVSSQPTFHPFVCVDDDEGAAFEFLPRTTPTDEQKRIATAFRSLMLAHSQDLAPFTDYCTLDAEYDSYFVKLGLDTSGRFFELDEPACDYDDPVPGWSDGHVCLPAYESRECDQCGGQGEESFFPAGELCEICHGRGQMNGVEPWSAIRKKRPKTAFRDW